MGAKVSANVVRELAGFKLLKELGEGGMGKVFLARQSSLDRHVALKVLQPELSADEEFIGRFHREAKSAAQLQHPNIVSVFDQGRDAQSGVHYIAFEYVDGGSLEDLLDNRGTLPEAEALPLFRAVASALEYAADKDIIHRDVKPENILLTRGGLPKLADLGLARQGGAERHVTQTGVVLGTPLYMAPEQALGEPDLDIRVDLYALGLCLWRSLTGLMPFDEDRTATALQILSKHIHQDLPDVRTRAPGVTEGTAKVVGWLAARRREDRYPSADQVVRDLALLMGGCAPIGPQDASSNTTVLAGPNALGPIVPRRRPSSGRLAPVTAPPPPAGRPTLPIVAGVLIAALGIGIGMALAVGRRRPRPPAPVTEVAVVAPATTTTTTTVETIAAIHTGWSRIDAALRTDASGARPAWEALRAELQPLRPGLPRDEQEALRGLDEVVLGLLAALEAPPAERVARADALAARLAEGAPTTTELGRAVDHLAREVARSLQDVVALEELFAEVEPRRRLTALQALRHDEPLRLLAQKLARACTEVDTRMLETRRREGPLEVPGPSATMTLLAASVADLLEVAQVASRERGVPTGLARAALRRDAAPSAFLEARVQEAPLTGGRLGAAQGLLVVAARPLAAEDAIVIKVGGQRVVVRADRLEVDGRAQPGLTWAGRPALMLETRLIRAELRALDAATGDVTGERPIEGVGPGAASFEVEAQGVELARVALLLPADAGAIERREHRRRAAAGRRADAPERR